jgi:hypothetical protein
VNYTKEQLQGAPAASLDELTHEDGMLFRERSHPERSPVTADEPRWPGAIRPAAGWAQEAHDRGAVVAV